MKKLLLTVALLVATTLAFAADEKKSDAAGQPDKPCCEKAKDSCCKDKPAADKGDKPCCPPADAEKKSAESKK